MKKIGIISILCLSFQVNFSQELTINDGLRYAMDDITGTARFSGMSGAFGSLGGDLSAINVNPAGSLFFNNNFASFTGGSFNNNLKSNYFGTGVRDNFSTLDINQVGAVFIFKDPNPDNKWSKFSLGINYERTNDFDRNLGISGINPNNSISQYFVNQANITGSVSDFTFEQGNMGFETYITNFDEDTNSFISNVPSGSYRQSLNFAARGFNGKFTANFASVYDDKLFLGMNLNVHFSDYVRTTSLVETNSNVPNEAPQPTVRNIRFDNQLSAYGRGFSFNLGAIYKFTEAFRMGVAYESPTWNRINEELVQDLYTTGNLNVPAGDANRYYGSPIFIFPTYTLQTPGKVTGSMSYIFKNSGLLSIDVSNRNYANMEFRPRNEGVFNGLNNAVDNELGNALSVRVGGEIKIKQASLRGGYRFEQSPYRNGNIISDLTGFSLGTGYNFGDSRLDLAFATSTQHFNQNLISSGMNDTARVKNTNNNVVLTYSINF